MYPAFSNSNIESREDQHHPWVRRPGWAAQRHPGQQVEGPGWTWAPQGVVTLGSRDCLVSKVLIASWIMEQSSASWQQWWPQGLGHNSIDLARKESLSCSFSFFSLSFLPSSHSNRHGDGQIFLCIFGHIHEDSSEKRSRKDIMRAELISSCFNFIGFFPNYNNNLHILWFNQPYRIYIKVH